MKPPGFASAAFSDCTVPVPVTRRRVPIRSELRHHYGAEWKRLSHRIRAERAGWSCEWCGVAHRAWGWRDQGGRFHLVPDTGDRRPPFTHTNDAGLTVRVIEIVLATAHLDHNPANNDEANLAALCQRCHLAHDLRQHRRNAAIRRRHRMRTLELFAG